MKKTLLFCFSFISLFIYSQSLKNSELEDFANNQNMQEIRSLLTSKDFIESHETKNQLKFTSFTKGSERVTITVAEPYFMVIYITSVDNAISKANSILLKGYKYSHTYKNNEYFDSPFMRIGINRESGVLTLIKYLKSK